MSFFSRDNDPKKFQFDLKWKLMGQRLAKVEFKHFPDDPEWPEGYTGQPFIKTTRNYSCEVHER